MSDYNEIPALNWSSLVAMATSPLLYQWRTGHPRPDTAALALGRAVHVAVLEPERYEQLYAVEPEWENDWRTKLGKAERASWRSAVGERETLTGADHETVRRCVAAVGRHADAPRHLAGGRAEEVVQWRDELTGRACKGRLDLVGATPPRLVDLKTTRALARFSRDAAAYLYHGQLAWYRDGAVAAHVLPQDAEAIIVAVETVEPYDCGCYRLGPHVLDAGRSLYRRLLGLWCQCEETGLWPGLCPGTEDLELPPWAEGPHEPEGW